MHAVLITPPGRPLVGGARPPGSKSITNRALLLAALAGPGRGARVSRITGALKSEDTARMGDALKALGVGVREPSPDCFEVTAPAAFTPAPGPLDLGNAGTAVRFLTAAAVLVPGETVLDGDAHMRRRPIAPLVAALRGLGVAIEAPTGCPPVRLLGSGRLPGGRVEIDASLSSQYGSALLMAAARAEAPLEVVLKGTEIGARGYLDLTLAAMRAFGADAEVTGPGSWRVLPTGYRPAEFVVEPDASAAVYLWCAERLTGGRIDLGGTAQSFSQPDAAAFAVIARYPDLPAVIDGSQIQDAVPALAVLAAFGSGPVRFTGIANLRVKECDRIAATAAELDRIAPGLGREEGDDLIVSPRAPPERSRPLPIRTYGDHRIAMSFALAGLRLPGIAITDPSCVGKTWPGYWRALEGLGVALQAVELPLEA